MFASAAILVNHTIDDVYGDSSTGLFPIYSPSDKWAVGSMCTTCSIFPGNLGFNGPGLAAAEVDITQAFMQTWHDSTYIGGPPVNVSVYFVGQAVYVYNIIANAVPDITTNTSLGIPYIRYFNNRRLIGRRHCNNARVSGFSAQEHPKRCFSRPLTQPPARRAARGRGPRLQ